MKKTIAAFIIAIMMICQTSVSVSADETVPLQVYFSDDGKTMNIFTSEQIDEDAGVLIGNETLDAEVKNSGVKINTVFLIDNSTSMPYSLRDKVKEAVSSYVSSMPENEKVKVAVFDTKTKILADEYSNDREFIEYELSKIDFNGQASLVYDAVMNVVNKTDFNKNVYYRTVLITDGIDSEEGTSFDYLRSEISENCRYHVDVVQVSEESKKDVNLTAIGNLGSNTYTLFKNDENFKALTPGDITQIRVELTNEVTTGELKGVTIKNSGSNISLGSVMFPQVEIASPVTTITTQTNITSAESEETTTISETKATTVTKADNVKNSGNFPKIILLIAMGGVIIAGAAVGTVIVILRKKSKKSLTCNVAVEVTKDDKNDQINIGADVWAFPVSTEFRVGRTLEPTSNDRTPLPRNHRAICENATNEDISSIGRNAFALTYNRKTNEVTIRNIAKNAMFSVETAGKHTDVRSGQSTVIMEGSKILLGNYTTVIIHKITVNNS